MSGAMKSTARRLKAPPQANHGSVRPSRRPQGRAGAMGKEICLGRFQGRAGAMGKEICLGRFQGRAGVIA